MRENLDPFEQYEDASVWQALQNAHLGEYISGLPGKLSEMVSQGGENFSVGQRQVIYFLIHYE